MLSDFLTFCYAAIPIIVYSGIIYLSTPKGSVRISNWSYFICGGILSALSVLLFHSIFPQWQTVFYYKDPMSGVFWYCLVTVALLEELSKFAYFKIFQRNKHNLIATCFYYCAIGGGFAIAENLMYGFQYGEAALITRAFSATVIHMALGIFAGYFIALGDRKVLEEELSELSNILNTPTKRKWFYNILALSSVILLHGLYDFNLTYETEYTLLFHYFIMLAILLGARQAFKRIVSLNAKEIC